MKFCSECENMLYTKINQEDNSLQYNCKNCGFESKKKPINDKKYDANIIKAQERIEKKLGLKVYISNKKNNRGKITIEYKDLEQFELISKLLTKS